MVGLSLSISNASHEQHERRHTRSPPAFAFVEFRREDDAEDGYYDMWVGAGIADNRHGRSIDGRRLTVQWAKRPPSAAWRHEDARRDGRDSRDRRDDRDHGRRSPRRRSPSPRRGRDRDDERSRDYERRGGRDEPERERESEREREPERERDRSRSPRSRSRSRSRSPRRDADERMRSKSPAANGDQPEPERDD